MSRAEDIFEKIKKEGLAAIDGFISTRKSEELFLDFKRSADNGDGKILHQRDRENLAKAISGFGNSEGGVIVWGIECSKDDKNADVAHAKHPIKDIKRFLSWLEGSVSGCTVPPHPRVEHHSLSINDIEGFVITFIPISNYAPHQVVVDGRKQYYIRVGSNFEPTPHAVLAGMFGRRPQPDIYFDLEFFPPQNDNGRIYVVVDFMLTNKGLGIAKDLFMSMKVNLDMGDNCIVDFDPCTEDWMIQRSSNGQTSIISKPELRLPPGSTYRALRMRLHLIPPFTRDLMIEGLCGSSDSITKTIKMETESSVLDEQYKMFLDNNIEKFGYDQLEAWKAYQLEWAQYILSIKL